MRIYFLLLAILAILLAGWVAWFITNLQAPSFAYENVALAGPGELCPGQQLVVTFDARSKSEPLILEIVENVANADTGLPVLSDTQPAWVINRANGVLHLTLHFTVPALPAGHYEYRRAADSSITRPIAFSVPFSVPAGCQ